MNIDDSTITPAKAGEMIKGEGETLKEQEKTPEPKVKTPVEEKEEVPLIIPEEKEKEKEKTALPIKRSIYQDLKEKKAEVREAKGEVEAMRVENTRLAEEIETLKQAKTPVADDEIVAFAESINADPEAIAGLIPILEKRLKKGEIFSKEDLDLIKQVKAEQQKMEGQIAFNNEWDVFIPSLKTEFPHVSDADLINVRKEVERLAHTPEFYDKEIDYIYFKTKNLLSKLISPKRPSIDGGGDQVLTMGKSANIELSGQSSPIDVQNVIARDSRSSQLEIRSSK